ncbi:HpcH/HpaI aldolase family protein [Candidatus Poriferisocius sp.]|uniref:HpcH/HpaI aldolase family protein n=1 Tax=Candidatus Poriferisocius sp. TaxID=3101276 RepID=UPI003B5A1ECD
MSDHTGSPHPLAGAFDEGRPALGAWAGLPTAMGCEIMSRAGFDYVCIDMQHGLADYSDALGMLAAIDLGTATPVVRVPWNEQGIIGRMLDAGALGIIVPMVNSRAEAETAVRSCRYAPEGARSVGPVRASLRDGPGYFAGANRAVQCIPMVETTTALQHLDDILSTPGVDAIYVGPSDLSVSLGLGPGNNDGHADFDDALATIVAACGRHGVVPGIHSTPTLAPTRIEQGFRMVTVTADSAALTAAVTGHRQSVLAALDGHSEANSKEADRPSGNESLY